jgi:hypothetical protein
MLPGKGTTIKGNYIVNNYCMPAAVLKNYQISCISQYDKHQHKCEFVEKLELE